MQLLQKNKFNCLTILLVCDKNLLCEKLYKKLTSHYVKVDVVETDIDAINYYQKYKYNIVLLNNKQNSFSTDAVIHFIKETKRKQIILLIDYQNNLNNLDVSNIIQNPENFLLTSKNLLKCNKQVIQRNEIRNNLLKNRLNLFLEKKDATLSFVYTLIENDNSSSKDLFAWTNICQSCLTVNEKFENLVLQLQNSKSINEENLKQFGKILNSYYQIFNFIKETNDLSFFLLKYASYFYSLKIDENLKNNLIVLINYVYMEILYFQYIIFFRNELKNINYFKTCVINSFKYFEEKLENNIAG